MGLVEQLPTVYNNLLAAILILLRTVHGYAAFLGCKMTVECCRAWFPDHFDLTIGLEVSGYYLGGSFAILMGGYVYEACGYYAPYLSFALIALTFWIYNIMAMPKTSDPVLKKPNNYVTETAIEAPWANENGLSEEERREDVPETVEEVVPCHGLSWLISIPLFAMSLTVVLEGFTAAITTPYLTDTFDVKIGRGSSYVFIQYIGLTVGAAISGSILQLGWFSASKVMALGSFLGLLGVLLVFPGEGIQLLYKLVPQLAYLGVFLQGYGSQMIGVASLSAVEQMHTVIGQRSYSKSNKSAGATLWLCVWMGAVYGGHLVALMVMKYMSFTQGGWMLAGFSAVSVAMCIAQDITVNRFINLNTSEPT